MHRYTRGCDFPVHSEEAMWLTAEKSVYVTERSTRYMTPHAGRSNTLTLMCSGLLTQTLHVFYVCQLMTAFSIERQRFSMRCLQNPTKHSIMLTDVNNIYPPAPLERCSSALEPVQVQLVQAF